MGYEEFDKKSFKGNPLAGLSVSVNPRAVVFSEEATQYFNGKVVCLFDSGNRKMAFRPASAGEFNGYSPFRQRGGRGALISCGGFVAHVFGKVEKATRYRATWNGTLLEVDLNAGPMEAA